ncbi:MAG: pre-peptidase C-terminal domain-containing protein, partial [Planctomycetaceae bacterium]
MRVITDHGCSEAAWVVVDDLPTVPVTAEADNRSAGQQVSVPCSIAGQLNAVAPRFFRFSLAEGQVLTAEVFARRLSSELDPVLRLLGPDGRELAYSDDVPGTEGDALLQWKAAAAGEYRLELRDVRYTGGARHFFHLRLGRIPAAVTALPRLVTAGAALSLLDAQGAVIAQAVAGESVAGAGSLVPIRSRGADAEAASIVSAVVVAGMVAGESEPNDAREQATAVAADAVGISAVFQQPGDVDWFRISATAAGNLTALARTRDAASPSDLQLELYNADGGKLAEADDAGPKDAEISFQLPAAGDYFLKVTELAGRSGPVWSYGVQLHLGKPSVLVTLPADRLSVPRGGSASLVLGLRRLQYDGPLKVEAVGLPAALQMEPFTVGGRQSAVPLVLTATDPAATAGDADWGPISVRVSAVDGSVPATVVQLVPPPPRKADADLFRSMRSRADLFVAVRPAGEFSLQAVPAAVTVEQGATATVTVKAVRGKDWTVPIELALATPADQLSPGVAVAGGNLTADELAITITAAADAAVGPCTVFLQGKS